MEDCLKNVIKLSRNECECFDEGKPEEFNEGQFDIYVDELEGMNLKMIGGAQDCEEGGIWDIMLKARENATKQFKADILACLNSNFMPSRKSYSGVLGQATFTGSLALNESTIGQVLIFTPVHGGYLKIKRIGLAITQGITVNVSIYDNDANASTPIGTFAINTVANQLTFATLSVPLELPMWSNSGKRLEYYIVYSRGTAQPKNLKTDCGCGVTKPDWQQWIKVHGIKGNDTNYSSFNRDSYLNGLILDVDFNCKSISIICNDNKPLSPDEGNDLQTAYAIRWKTGEFIWQKILDSPHPNIYTLMDRERLYGNRNHARKMYNDFIAFLCENVSVQPYGCLMCKPNPNFYKSNALA